MFDIGWSELLVIAAVALIVIGPKELPGVLRSVGHWMGKIRRMATDFQNQFQEAMREAEMADLKKHADDLNQSVKSLTSGLDPYDIARDVEAAARGSTDIPAAPPPETSSVDGLASTEPSHAAPHADTVPLAPDAPPAKGTA